MAKRLRTHLDDLKFLKKATPSVRKAVLKTADNELIRCLCDCSHNILKGNIKLNDKNKKILTKHRGQLRALASKKLTLKKKRNLMVQKGGFLPALIGPILGVATSLLSTLIK